MAQLCDSENGRSILYRSRSLSRAIDRKSVLGGFRSIISKSEHIEEPRDAVDRCSAPGSVESNVVRRKGVIEIAFRMGVSYCGGGRT